MKLGDIQKLTMKRRVDFGVYLTDGDTEVLLPKKQVPQGLSVGDEVEVFLYNDSSDRLISTVTRPLITLGETAALTVKQLTGIGAFMDWGLEKDLLLPFREQTKKLAEGEEVLCALYVDKSGRLAATMKVYPYLKLNSPYRIDDRVEARIYDVSERFGAYAAVDDTYSGLIPPSENMSALQSGQKVSCRVAMVKEDGKLDLSLREKAYMQMDDDAAAIMLLIEDKGGELSFNDKADPSLIKEETGLSKAAFKRAVGRLYKERKIVITDHSIRKNL